MPCEYNVWEMKYSTQEGATMSGKVKGYFVSDQAETETLGSPTRYTMAIAHFPITPGSNKNEQYQHARMFCNWINQESHSSPFKTSHTVSHDTNNPISASDASAIALAVIETTKIIARLQRNSTPAPTLNFKTKSSFFMALLYKLVSSRA
jgi:hypothetical protein